MPAERPIVNVRGGGTPVKSAKDVADAGVIQVNTAGVDEQLPPIEETDSLSGFVVDEEEEMCDEEIEGRRKMAEFFALPADQQKARLAVVLDRGVVFDRLKVQLPDDLHGEWVRNDPLDIDRMRTLGFWIDNTYASKRALHSDGSSANVVGDVIHVVTTKQNKKMIDTVRLEQQLRSARNPRKAVEEEQEKSSVPEEIPTFSESNQRVVTVDDVKAALGRADGQTKVQR